MFPRFYDAVARDSHSSKGRGARVLHSLYTNVDTHVCIGLGVLEWRRGVPSDLERDVISLGMLLSLPMKTAYAREANRASQYVTPLGARRAQSPHVEFSC